MKNRLLIILTLFLSTTLLQADETYDLNWKFKKGDTYIIEYEGETKTTTIVKDEQNPKGTESSEISKDKHEFQLDVKNTDKNGSAEVLLSINSFEKNSNEKNKNLFIKASKDRENKKTSTVKISSTNQMLQQPDVKKFFKDFAEAMLDIQVMLKVSNKGIVLNKKMLNDPFKNMKGDTMIVKMIMKLVKKMISPEDIESAISSELFTQLPENKIAMNSPWDINRSFSIIGIEAVGKGTAKIDKAKKRMVVINESVTYKASAEKFSKMMEEIIKDTLKQSTGQKIDVTMDFKIKDDFVCDYESHFDYKKGYNTRSISKKIAIPVIGKMKMKFGEKTFEGDMMLNVVGASSMKCRKK